MNGFLANLFSIRPLKHLGCSLPLLLYILALETLLRKVRVLECIPRDLGFGRSIAAHVNDIIVSSGNHLRQVVDAIKEYETVGEVKINPHKSVGLLLGTWRNKSMPSYKIVGRWTDNPVEILGVWFGTDHQTDKNWSRVMSWVAGLSEIWSGRQLSLKVGQKLQMCLSYLS